MSGLIHFLNGKFISEDKLVISPRDLGFSRGCAVHEFVVTNNNQPFKLSEHIERLFKSAEIIGLKIPWNKIQIVDWAKETFDKNDKNTEKTMRIFLTGGKSDSMRYAKVPTLIMIVSPRIRKQSSDYEKGIKIKAVKYRRPYPEAKTNIYIEGVKQLSEAGNERIEEIIYYDESQVYEGAGSSLFAIINSELVTAKSDIIEGITRNTLLQILHLPIAIEVRNFTFDELQHASEVFLTGSNSEVRGVIEINGKSIGNGKVGNITKEVLEQYREYILQTIN